MDLTSSLEAFAAEIGDEGPVACAGGRTQWDLGGSLIGGARVVSAPSGVVRHEPGEMIVRARAGTTLAELDRATSRGGQFVALEADQPELATLGGILACGRSGPRRLGRGAMRDTVLEATFVDHCGRLVRVGAPLVKNVTGFDVCRILVGSLGTLGFLAEVVLRCQPLPEAEAWWCGEGADPFDLAASLYRPLGVLWDGTRTWVGLAGYRVDVEDQHARLLAPLGFRPAPGPPAVPEGATRLSAPPGALTALRAVPGEWLAEVGVGVVHAGGGSAVAAAAALGDREVSPAVVELHRRIKDHFDPSGRLNPGRSPLRAAS